jgi:hypothetical protein
MSRSKTPKRNDNTFSPEVMKSPADYIDEANREYFERLRKRARSDQAQARFQAELDGLSVRSRSLKMRRYHTPLAETYDLRCSQVFRNPEHEKAFRTFVTSEQGQAMITKFQQFAFAQEVDSRIEHFTGRVGMRLDYPQMLSWLPRLAKGLGLAPRQSNNPVE